MVLARDGRRPVTMIDDNFINATSYQIALDIRDLSRCVVRLKLCDKQHLDENDRMDLEFCAEELVKLVQGVRQAKWLPPGWKGRAVK